MPINTQIAQRIMDEINEYQEQKNSIDSLVNLDKGECKTEKASVSKVEAEENYMTLLSEGSVLYQDGSIRLYIAKGTLQKWYDSIDETYEGYVTTGHIDLNAFPVREGYFRKADLKVVTDASGRSDLLVKPHVNTQLSNIKDLIIQDEPFSISSEFRWYDKEITDDDIEEYAKLVVYNIEHGGDVYVPITDTVEIKGFSFVGNPGNAKSGGYEPSVYLKKEEELLDKKEILSKVLEKLSTETKIKEDEVVETKVEEVVEEDATEETAEVEADDKVAEALAKATACIEELEAENAKLKEENTELKSAESEVDEQLAKLEKLLSKTTTVVEAPVEKKEAEVTSIFGRKRFGGQ